jgi:hypothetical protein
MNILIALAVVCISISVVTGLIAGIFKILIFGDFKMDAAWFDYKLTFQQLRWEWIDKEKNKIKFAFRVAFFFFSHLANTCFLIGIVLFAVGFLRGK